MKTKTNDGSRKEETAARRPAARTRRLLLGTLCLPWLAAGCVSGLRTQSDEVKFYDAGSQVRGPRITLGTILGIQVFTVDLGLKSSVEEPAVAGGASLLSRTGLESFNADVESERGATNTFKRVGYDTRGLTTEVSTNAAPLVESTGSAAGTLIHKAATGRQP